MPMNRPATILLLSTLAATGCVTTEEYVDGPSGPVLRPPVLPSRADKPVTEADVEDVMNARERALIVA